MARTKGSKNKPKDTTKYLAQRRTVKKDLRTIARDLWVNDVIVICGLVASGVQIAIAFSYSTVGSVGSAIFKALFIEASIYSLNRAISWAAKINLGRSKMAFLWFVLVMVMFISTRANLAYEVEKLLTAKNSVQCESRPELCVPSQKNVNEFLDSNELLESWLRSGLIPLLVLAMIFARRILTSGSLEFEAEESRRIVSNEKQSQYKALKKQPLRRIMIAKVKPEAAVNTAARGNFSPI